ncbi:hypothetical protein WISP_75307 [Willisornis vidua]|uniref:Uncharacterized protein n=1 Tax=Willisornis vidua TaxID=1566151 RepID=A0ABQ9DC82_9PASS|nr:hypothetical protein WISP_75307 [Willisornis vidua]
MTRRAVCNQSKASKGGVDKVRSGSEEQKRFWEKAECRLVDGPEQERFVDGSNYNLKQLALQSLRSASVVGLLCYETSDLPPPPPTIVIDLADVNQPLSELSEHIYAQDETLDSIIDNRFPKVKKAELLQIPSFNDNDEYSEPEDPLDPGYIDPEKESDLCPLLTPTWELAASALIAQELLNAVTNEQGMNINLSPPYTSGPSGSFGLSGRPQGVTKSHYFTRYTEGQR